MNESSEALPFPSYEARITTLPNGLEILVREDHAAPVVSLQAWVRTGSIHEGSRLGAGLSHFLEHMMFKGTPGRDANQIAQTVQAAGGYINAYTSFERTVYWIDAPSAGFVTCLEVLCDVVANALLPEEEVANESDVIRREIAMGEDNPDQVLSKLFFRTAYSAHPCRHPVIGHLDLFNQLTREDLHDCFSERYSPDNVFIVVAGNIDTDEVVARIGEALGPLPRRRRAPVIITPEPPQVGPRQGELPFPTELHRERIAWQVPDGLHPDAPALDVLAGILGQGRSSRLFQGVRESQQLAHSIGAWSYTPSFAGQFRIHFDTEAEKAPHAREAALHEVERLVTEGISDGELEKARRQILASQFSIFDEVRSQASDIGGSWLLARNPDHTRHYLGEIQRLDRETVRDVAERYLVPGRHTSVSLFPAKSVARAPHIPVAKRSEEVHRIELENGLTVLLLQDRRVPIVQASGVFRGGMLAETPGTAGTTRLLSRLLTKDTLRRSAEALAETIEGVGGGIEASAGNNTFGVSVHALRPDLELVVDLLGETLTEPAFLESVVTREKSYQIAQIKAEADRPFSVAMKALRRSLFGTHPYGLEPGGTEGSIASLHRGQLTGMLKARAVGGNGVVGIFGDLDPRRAEDLIRARFETTLPSGPRQFTTPGEAMGAPQSPLIELSHEKEQAVLLIGFRTVPLHHPDDPSLELIDEACSDMASRFFIRIREELGLAYSVGASRMAGLEPGYLVFYASTAPEKLDLVQAEMLAEIDLIVNEGLAVEEFERARASWLGREAIRLQGVRSLASSATIDELVGLGWDHYRQVPDIIQGLELDHIREVARRHLREDQRVIVRLSR